MSDAAELLQQAVEWSDRGLGVALATVLSTWGSAPRRPGSQLAVSERGELVGSVSGGCVEGAVAEEALAALRDGRPRTLEFGVTEARAWAVGLACGGTIRVHVARLMERAVLEALRADVAASRPVVLATDLASGSSRLLHPDEAEVGVEPPLLAAAGAAARDDASRTWEGPGGAVFLTVYNPPVRLVVVGAVHVAQPLVAMARLAGYDVVVVDPRPAFATAARFPGVPLVCEWPDAALARLAPGRRTAVVAMTHDEKLDDPALAAALRSEAFYVGALGSKKTQAARRERLLRLGLDEAALDRLHAPVGLPLGAVSTGEIAVAILAEIVGCLRSARGRPSQGPP